MVTMLIHLPLSIVYGLILAFTHCGPDTVSGVPRVKRVDLEGTIANPGALSKPKLPCSRVPVHVEQFDIARCIAL
jgi:hypothetical protein